MLPNPSSPNEERLIQFFPEIIERYTAEGRHELVNFLNSQRVSNVVNTCVTSLKRPLRRIWVGTNGSFTAGVFPTVAIPIVNAHDPEDPHATVCAHRSGAFSITGVVTKETVQSAIYITMRTFFFRWRQACKIYNLTFQNAATYGVLKRFVDLDKLALTHRGLVHYTPRIFRGARVKLLDPPVKATVFNNGAVIIVGNRSPQMAIAAAITFFDMLEPFLLDHDPSGQNGAANQQPSARGQKPIRRMEMRIRTKTHKKSTPASRAASKGAV